MAQLVSFKLPDGAKITDLPKFEKWLRENMFSHIEGSATVEDLPEPNRVQEFLVRVKTQPHQPSFSRSDISMCLLSENHLYEPDLTVTEVEVS